jgi:hypothetical protein
LLATFVSLEVKLPSARFLSRIISRVPVNSTELH